MCGIYGYLGPRPLLDTLLGGLRRLEYRGYDSAGIGFVEAGAMKIYKEKGKIQSLADAVAGVTPASFAGISHTRWATHGAPEAVNAHPHLSFDGKVCLVHNGIIENYRDLKERLQAEGVRFTSQTDTEVVVHLVAKAYRGDLEKAVLDVIPQLEGTYGLAVITTDEPNRVVTARKGSPLLIGVGAEERILASDAAAIVSLTRDVVYLEDGEVASLEAKKHSLRGAGKGRTHRPSTRVDMDASAIEKKGYAHFMLKEIFEQAETVENTIRGRVQAEEGNVKLGGVNMTPAEAAKVKRLIIAACGTSWHAGLVGEYLLENHAGLPVEVDYASEFTHRSCRIEDDSVFLVISQSGETADTLAALREAKAHGVRCLGIVNAVGSTIARETDGGIYLHAGPEIGVASTKAFTSQVAALALLTVFFGRQRGMSADQGRAILKALTDLPGQIRKVLEGAPRMKELAAKYLKGNHALYLGRSYNFPVALEGALKLKEISYVHAEGYPAAEMKHGPIALIDPEMPVVVVATKGDTYAKVVSNIQEVRARGGKIIAIASEGDDSLAELAETVFHVPETIPMLAPILNVIPLQLLAYYAAVERGCDVDQPRNLAKSVTVE